MKGTVILLIIIVILLLILGIGGISLYNNLNKKAETVEVNDVFVATESGQGIGRFAQCPEGKEVISGGCSSDSAPTKFILHAEQPTKSKETIDYNNAWMCSFSATEAGEFRYTVIASCK